MVCDNVSHFVSRIQVCGGGVFCPIEVSPLLPAVDYRTGGESLIAWMLEQGIVRGSGRDADGSTGVAGSRCSPPATGFSPAGVFLLLGDFKGLPSIGNFASVFLLLVTF